MFELIRRLKNFYWRGKRGYSDEDAWGLHSYLAEIIPPIVRMYKKGSGCPGELYDKSRKNDECWKWKEILEEIAQGFEASVWLSDVRFMKYMKGPKDSYDLGIDEKARKEMSNKFDVGLQLFVKWFHGLWD